MQTPPPKRPRGRPRTGQRERIILRLDAATVAHLRQIGDGNISLGGRTVLDRYAATVAREHAAK